MRGDLYDLGSGNFLGTLGIWILVFELQNLEVGIIESGISRVSICNPYQIYVSNEL